ncbi:hypothetical protein [Weissella cibaria]|uniref:hypothetical protein n=1 Tax=Weissella cibaria TaxID=137591 RepID=UPI0013DCB42F|nr:hypothetical protein [Weissella cibaria]NFA02946.1 hypothetical protein [Weissella cibaria]
MSVFQDIIKGMADGAETLQANFVKLAKAISAIDDDGTIHFGKVSAENLAVPGDTNNWQNAVTPSNITGTISYRVINNVLYIKGYGIKGITGTGSTNGLFATFPDITVTNGDRWGIPISGSTYMPMTLNGTTNQLYLAGTNGSTVTSSTFFTLNAAIPL